MNRDIMIAAGFKSAIKAVDAGLCPFCGVTIADTTFRDELSLREFKISGLCQKCQDTMFDGGDI